MKYIKIFIPALFSMLLACNNQEDVADAYGNFEAIEVMISAEAQGRILAFEAVEGEVLNKGQVIVVIDTLQLQLKKAHLESVILSLNPKISTLDAQVEASLVQMNNLIREEKRINKLVEGGAATPKQKDDIEGQIALLKAQIVATESQKASVYAERRSLEIQIQQVEDQIGKSTVRNPGAGTMLTKYKEMGEIAAPGQPLYKVANLKKLILRAYVSGDQLSEITLGKTVTVRFDVPGGMDEVTGTVSWVSDRAEFTPKIIQTKEERVNLVYALKIVVPNDGRLKIGMPGEVMFK